LKLGSRGGYIIRHHGRTSRHTIKPSRQRETTMKCPHCLVPIHVAWSVVDLIQDRDYVWSALQAQCPACKKMIIQQVKITPTNAPGNSFVIRPEGLSKVPLSS
jgi:hypothetical protein